MNKEQSNNPRIGVVLSSGGVRGVYAHTGFLQAVEQAGLKIQALAGCSAGAIVGGIYASGTSIEEWSESLSKITPKNFWSPSLLRMFYSFVFRQGRGYTGISTTKAAMEFCEKNLTAKTFETCKIPFYTLAKNLLHGCKTLFNSGELAPRIVASGAIPVMYEPVEIDNQLYCDGALLELSPTDAICCKHQLDILIVHHVAQRNKSTSGLTRIFNKPWSMIEILNLLLYQQRPWYLSDDPVSFKRCPCGCNAIIIVIEPELPELQWPVTKNAEKILDMAKQQVEILLKPYLDDVKNNKSNLMVHLEGTENIQQTKSGCGLKHAH